MEQKSHNSWSNKIQLGKSQEFYLQIHGGGGGGLHQEHTPAESNDLLEMAVDQPDKSLVMVKQLSRSWREKWESWTGIRPSSGFAS